MMKTRFTSAIILVSMVSCNFLFAQEETVDKSLKYFNKTEAGVSIGIGNFKTDMYNGVQKSVKNDEIIITLQTVNGFKYMDRVGIGVSFGAEYWGGGLFWPVYGYLGYDFKRADNTFFADIYIGYAPGYRESTSFYHEGYGAFAMSIGLGYRMKISNKLKFMYEIFYKYQSLESYYYSYVEKGDSTIYTRKYDTKIPLSFAGFKIGICFP
jgi:hypothetical protein